MSDDEYESSEGPLVRSLSMSRNMAYSVVDEVPHMITFLPPETAPAGEKRSWWKPSDLRKSSSTSSLLNIRHQIRNSDGDARASHLESLRSFRRGSVEISQSVYEYDDDDDEQVSKFNNNSERSHRSSSSGHNAVENVLQALPPIVKGIRRNDLLVGIVVSRWDNIVGPQSVYLWTEELTSVFYPMNLPQPLNKLVKYVTDHTVDHQTATGGYIPPTVQRTTLCIVPDLNLAYLSLSIRVPTEIDTILEFQSSSPMTANNPDHPALTMPHSISVLSNLKYLNQFLLLRPLTTSWLVEFGPQIGVLLCKDNLQSSMINSWCAELCKTITALQTCWAQEIADLDDSSFTSSSSNINLARRVTGNESERGYGKLPEGADVIDMSYLPPNSPSLPKSSLGTLLTSHLTSFGSSIVVGYDCLAVNQVIRFLLCFATSQEGYCSRYALATLPDTFMKGLFIQGLILGGIGERSISYKQVACNRLPLTRVELGSKVKVRQTSVSTHAQEKEAVIMQELNKLWSSTTPAIQPVEAFSNAVKGVAGFVSQFLLELELLPPELRYGRLLLLRRAIHAKAVSLITFLHSIQHKPPKEKTNLKQMIPQILGFDNAEYIIVQVTAEKIRPGVLSLLSQ